MLTFFFFFYWSISWSSNTLATWCKELTHWKRPWCWEDWMQEEKGTTEDEMVGWHHQLNEHELEQAPGVGDGQGRLACSSPWGRKESDTTGRLNWTELNNWFTMLSSFSCTAKWISYTYIYPLFFRFFFLRGYYRVLSRISCTTQVRLLIFSIASCDYPMPL